MAKGENQLTSDSAFRSDIQALRGFAVLLVLLYHANVSIFPAGYLGVDVFFVVSGYLITRLIVRDLEAHRFTFAGFYFRRAKRLLPAAYVAFAVTAIIAPFFLAAAELNHFLLQMVGAVTFTANVVLWTQSGYFGGDAALAPLLHVWSLAIEEQYYLLLPAALAFTPKRLWLKGALLLLLGSLALCLARPGHASTFFLLPTRAWELLIGSAGALIVAGPRLAALLRLAFWPSVAAMCCLPLIEARSAPGPSTLLICLATLVLILREHPLLPRSPVIRGLGKVGDMSYSLYLVHWPLFAFLNNVLIGHVGGPEISAMRVGLIALSFGLGYALFRHVELPMRKAPLSPRLRTVVPAEGASAALVLVTAGIVAAITAGKGYEDRTLPNYGFNAACEFTDDFELKPACTNSASPRVLVWGDSHAMHLVLGIANERPGGIPVIQATRSVCGPILGVAATMARQGLSEKWAKDCIRFNDSVLEYLKGAAPVETVVLSSTFTQFVDRAEARLLKRDAATGGHSFAEPGRHEAVAAMERTVGAIRALGKRVVVVAPPPSNGRDMSRCIERLQEGLRILGADPGCRISLASYRQHRSLVLDFLDALHDAGVDVVRFDGYLCDAEFCRTHVDGTFIYRDSEHLSRAGSVFLARAVLLNDRINERAR